MMPDLGKYAADVLAAYGLTILLLLVLLLVSLRQNRASKKRLAQIETAPD